MAESIRTMINYLTTQFSSVGINDVIDIIVVAIVLYYIFRFVRDRRASKLALGLILLFVLYILSDFFELLTIKFFMDNIFQVGIIALLIVFQPELRSMLESFAGQTKRFKALANKMSDDSSTMIEEICTAAHDLSAERTGALILIQRNTPLGDYTKSGTIINADISSLLLRNLFFNKSPLHDGAVIISDGRIQAAGCFLPLSMNTEIMKELGTRHRAAIGASENSDAVVIVVSEETGKISVACDGKLVSGYTPDELKEFLTGIFIVPNNKRVRISMPKFIKKTNGGENNDD